MSAPPRRRGATAIRVVATLGLLAASAWGARSVGLTTTNYGRVFPGEVALSVALALLSATVLTTALAWHRLRPRWALAAVCGGALAAIALASLLEPPLLGLVDDAYDALRGGWDLALIDAPVEELCKLACVVALGVLARGVIGSGQRAMVLGAVVGVGFQTVETHFDAVIAAYQADVSGGNPWWGTAFQWMGRSVELGIWLHPADTAIAAAGVALIWAARHDVRPGAIRLRGIGLIALAIAHHIYWDAPFLRGPGRISDVIFGAVPRAVSGIVAGVLVYRAMRRRDHATMTTHTATAMPGLSATPNGTADL